MCVYVSESVFYSWLLGYDVERQIEEKYGEWVNSENPFILFKYQQVVVGVTNIASSLFLCHHIEVSSFMW